MSDCGARLRINGTWVTVKGIKSGVGVDTERPGDGFTSIGGVFHEQRARRGRRSWSVDLGQLESPEVVAALMVAAQGDGGDVWLWDEQAARANMVDPLAIAPRPEYPPVNCGGLALRSLTRGPAGGASFVDVQAKANAAIASSGMAWDWWLGIEAGTRDALLKFSVPPAPAGMALASAQLILTSNSITGSGTVTAKFASNGWVEPGGGFAGTMTGYWTSIPGGTTAGSTALTADTTTISLSGVAAYASTDMSLRVSVAGSGTPSAAYRPRYSSSGYPVLRLNYGTTAYPRTFTQHIPGDVAVTVAFWTTAPDGTTVGTRTLPGGGTANLVVPATGGSGLRRVSVTIAAPGSDYDAVWTINDSTTYLLAGFGISSLAHDFYAAPHKTPVRVVVDDPTLSLDSLYAGEQGHGARTVTIREVG